MNAETLIRRDEPIPAGTIVDLRFELSTRVSVDEYLDGDESLTLAELEQRFSHGYGRRASLWLAAQDERRVFAEVDATWHPDVPDKQLGCQMDARFETEYEAEHRVRGDWAWRKVEYVPVPRAVSS